MLSPATNSLISTRREWVTVQNMYGQSRLINLQRIWDQVMVGGHALRELPGERLMTFSEAVVELDSRSDGLEQE